MEQRKINESWRQQSYTVPAKSMIDVVFDNRPNITVITNYGDAPIYVNVNGIPSASRYENRIGAGTRGVIGRPTAFDQVSVYNDSTSDTQLFVVSVWEEFTVALLKDFNVQLDNVVVETDGIIKGFTTSLPAGSNNIGSVDIYSMPALPAGGNNIGKVDINSLPSLPAGTNKIGVVTNSTTQTYFSRGATVAPAGTDTQTFTFDEINFLSNDGVNDITVEIQLLTSAWGNVITLKAGESISGFKCKGLGYRVSSVSGSSYRVLLGGVS